MSIIREEIAAFEAMQAKLEADAFGKWVLFHHRQLIGTFASFDAAADDAVAKFGSGPFLIRQVGARPVAVPASLAYAKPSA
jgi:hypothetical protein